MAETCKNTLIPESLIMRRCECFYCGAEDEGAVTIDWRFGIKVCRAHQERGERDCRAYLHRQNFVRIEDALRIPTLRRFLDILQIHPFLAVERTSGAIEDDWSFRAGSVFESAFFSFSSAGRWDVPMYNKRLNVNKSVPIINFLRPEITAGMVLPADWPTIIEDAIDTLTEGVYRADAEAYDYARNHDENETITETAGVATIVYEGQAERIFVGHLVDEGQQAITQSRPRENGTDRAEEIGDPTGEV